MCIGIWRLKTALETWKLVLGRPRNEAKRLQALNPGFGV